MAAPLPRAPPAARGEQLRRMSEPLAAGLRARSRTTGQEPLLPLPDDPPPLASAAAQRSDGHDHGASSADRRGADRTVDRAAERSTDRDTDHGADHSADHSTARSTARSSAARSSAAAPASPPLGGESEFDSAWAADAARVAAAGPVAATDSALERIVRTYAVARSAIGAALLTGVGVSYLLGSHVAAPIALLCIGYALQTTLWWLLPHQRAAARRASGGSASRRQWLATIGVDLAAFTGLHVLASDAVANFGALLVLPVLMAGVLSSRLVALGTAAAATLMLLAVAWQGAGGGAGGALLIPQSGLAGLGLFVIALLSGELASRLARAQGAARGSLELARQQAQLNRLVLEEMADGVLVVDHELRVRTSNPAARSLLAMRGATLPPSFQLQGRAEWAALVDAVRRAQADGRWPEAGKEIVLAFGGADTRALRMRVRFTRRRDLPEGEPLCVLLLEDGRAAQARLHQERLAAMGRVSAGVAHEIRNPLAAIAQANALLLEDALDGPQARLAGIVADNVRRLRRIVDDVLEVVPGAAEPTTPADAAAVVAAAAAEWARTTGVAIGGRLRLDLPRTALPVGFDAEHLRRVLVNLLDNAQRHASQGPGAIGVRVAPRDAASALLLVDSDGPPIDPEVEQHLFEPFFSTRSRGTGLGLYICRELCQRHGASIEYRHRADAGRNLFLVVMPRVRRDAARASGFGVAA